ncbi:MAG TPA: putative quinol monooxygenase [Bryobacteraceae bacterium]|nr:putative quinol monooxygenase [Bryobacteraceae bacterium]
MNTTLLTVVAEIIAKPGKEEEVRRHLLHMVEETRKEEGCVQYDLHVVNGAAGHFVFYETWTSETMLDKHGASAHISAFRAIAGDLTQAPTRILKATRIA